MKRANGEGTIYQNKYGTWTAQFTAPSGKRRSRAFPTQRKAREWLTEQRRDVDTGDYVAPTEITLDAWWDTWIETYKRLSVSAATLESYRHSKARVTPLLDYFISQITPADIQGLLNKIGGKRRTVEITRTALKMCFDRAVKNRMIPFSPVDDSTLPVAEHKHKVHALTEDEETALVTALSRAPRMTARHEPNRRDMAAQTVRDALLLILWTGISRGECAALKWDDWQGNMLYVRGTKNDGRVRRVPLSADALDLLTRRKAVARAEYIFAAGTGRPIQGRNLLRYMESISNHNVHDLRHTYCTKAARAGINPKVLQTITGHKKIETLLRIYTHVTDQDKIDAVEKIFPSCKAVARREENKADVSQ